MQRLIPTGQPANMVLVSESALETMKKMVAKLDADNKMLLECLEWYVQQDDVIEFMEGNEFWVDGKRRAESAIQQAKE